jgi:hypothetical protein
MRECRRRSMRMDVMQVVQRPSAPPLIPGERLAQPEFHLRYEAQADGRKFELIRGIVYPAPRRTIPEGTIHANLSMLLVPYQLPTPGVESLIRPTLIFGPEAEHQPSAVVRLLPEWGGQTRVNEERYIVGGPEFIIQIGGEQLELDLGDRRADCLEAGVCELLVIDVFGRRLRWFDLSAGGEIPLRGGVMRSRVFPGLWIAPAALFARDIPALTATLQQGIASGPHAKFVERLERARQRLARSSGQS